MFSKPNFEWQQAINMNKDIFLEYFAQASGLSKAKRQPINLMEEEHRVGVYFSSAAYLEWLNKINDMKHEIMILKTKKQEELLWRQKT